MGTERSVRNDVRRLGRRDPHELLGVQRGADRQQVTSAFREKARRGGHPDTGGDARTFQELALARDVLLDPRRLAAYEAGRWGAGATAPARPHAPTAQAYAPPPRTSAPPPRGYPPPPRAYPPPKRRSSEGGETLYPVLLLLLFLFTFTVLLPLIPVLVAVLE